VKNALTDLFKLRTPIVQAPMSTVTSPAMLVAACKAGALGMLAAFRMTPDALRAAIRNIRKETSGAFGVNFLLAAPTPVRTEAWREMQGVLNIVRRQLGIPERTDEPPVLKSDLKEALASALAEKVPVISFAMGDPAPFASAVHAAGAKLMVTVTNVDEARRAKQADADVIVAQGAEAGGHRSCFDEDDEALVGTMALVPQVIDAVPVPVVAAGGIGDGRGVAAALMLGAAGVQIGTRLLVAKESLAYDCYRERLLSARDGETVVTSALTGRPARALRNDIERHVSASGKPLLPYPYQALAAEDIYMHQRTANGCDYYPLLAGQALGSLKRGQSTAEIIAEITAEAEALLAKAASKSAAKA
jgi:nitronate monooxygenase